MGNLKRKHAIFLSFTLIFLTAISTFWMTTIYQIRMGDKVIINRYELEEYREIIHNFKPLNDLKQYIETNYYLEVDNDLLFEGMKKGLFEALKDPYSEFMNADEFENYMASTSSEYPGIGVYLTPNSKNQIEIIAPIEDTPAFRAGLLAQDIILAVDSEYYTAETLDNAIRAIKGEPKTKVKLTIYRPSKEETFDVWVERDWIDIKVVRSRMLESDLGYIRLSMFNEKSALEFKEHLQALIDQGAKGIVFDLRQNPGGYLDQSIEIADLFLDDVLVVYTESRNGENESFYSDKAHFDVDMVILIDEGSASASEIVTGALKDHGVATVVGSKSFGKGVVQVIKPYTEKTGFKLTTSQYFTPSGLNIHQVGIEPDIIIPLDPSYHQLKSPTDEDDNQLQTAIDALKKIMR